MSIGYFEPVEIGENLELLGVLLSEKASTDVFPLELLNPARSAKKIRAGVLSYCLSLKKELFGFLPTLAALSPKTLLSKASCDRLYIFYNRATRTVDFAGHAEVRLLETVKPDYLVPINMKALKEEATAREGAEKLKSGVAEMEDQRPFSAGFRACIERTWEPGSIQSFFWSSTVESGRFCKTYSISGVSVGGRLNRLHLRCVPADTNHLLECGQNVCRNADIAVCLEPHGIIRMSRSNTSAHAYLTAKF